MWQNKEKSIFPAICILCLVILAFVFVVTQNIVKADNIPQVSMKNESISDMLEDVTKDFIISNIYEARQKYTETFDIDTDYSFQKYVSDKNVLQNKKYVPSDLVMIDSEFVVNKAARPYLRQAAATAFDEMSQSFFQKFGKKIYIMSAYRTYEDQVRLVDWGCSNARCAKIGASEHQLGLALDIHVATKDWYTQFSSGYLDRMDENAYKYGFIITYSKWDKIDWKMKEIRHWRYVWVPFATELHEKDMSFAERVKDNEKLTMEDE